jgi:hypothetical protein
MFIDAFVWLPHIIEKIEVKHHVSQDEVEEVFFNPLDTDSLNQDIDHMRMYTQQVDRQTVDAI